MSKVRIVNNINGMSSVNVYFIQGHCCEVDYEEQRERRKKNTLLAGNLAYRESTAYLEIAPGKCELVFETVSTSSQIVKAKGMFSSNKHYTVILAGTATNPNHVLVYEDRTKCPRVGTSLVRFIQASQPSQATQFYDVYLNRTLVFSNVNFPNTGDPVYASQPVGNVAITVVPHDSPLTTSSLVNTTMIAGGIYTIIATSGSDLIILHDNPQRCHYTCDIVQKDFDLQKFTGVWYMVCQPQMLQQQMLRQQMIIFTLLTDRMKMTTVEHDVQGNQLTSTSSQLVPLNWCDPVAFTTTTLTTSVSSTASTTIIVHETDYCHFAIVGTSTRSILWLLSRTKVISESKCHDMIETARKLGYSVANRI